MLLQRYQITRHILEIELILKIRYVVEIIRYVILEIICIRHVILEIQFLYQIRYFRNHLYQTRYFRNNLYQTRYLRNHLYQIRYFGNHSHQTRYSRNHSYQIRYSRNHLNNRRWGLGENLPDKYKLLTLTSGKFFKFTLARSLNKYKPSLDTNSLFYGKQAVRDHVTYISKSQGEVLSFSLTLIIRPSLQLMF